MFLFSLSSLFVFQAALVNFATTGEKTVAAVLTCRNEVGSQLHKGNFRVASRSKNVWGFYVLFSQ